VGRLTGICLTTQALRCRDGSLYTGWTSDLERRMARHEAGKASRYTASRLPAETGSAQRFDQVQRAAAGAVAGEHGDG
jgi:putative endonuclease